MARIATDGYPAATAPAADKVINGERAIEIQDAYFLQERKATQQDVDDATENKFVDAKLLSENAGGGGGGLLGDIVLRDESQVTWTNNTTSGQSLLLCDGTRFSSAFYPELAALDDYAGFGTQYSTFTQNATNTIVTTTYTTIRLAHVDGYGTYAFRSTNTSTFEVFKSTDGGATWGSALTITPPFTGFIIGASGGVCVKEGTNEILVFNRGKAAIFDASIDDFTTTDQTVFGTSNVLLMHYNTNLSKWVLFLIDNGANDQLFIYTSPDAITWTQEYTSEPFAAVSNFPYFRGVSTDRCQAYHAGKYYFLGARDANSFLIFEIDENNLGLFADNIIFSLPSTPDLPAFTQICQPAVNQSGQIILPFGYRQISSPNGYLLEYYYSGNRGQTFEKRFIELSNRSGFTQHQPYVVGDGHDSFMYVCDNTAIRITDNGAVVADFAISFLPDLSNSSYTALGGFTIATDVAFSPMVIANGSDSSSINCGATSFTQSGGTGSDSHYTKDLSNLWSGELKAWVVTGK